MAGALRASWALLCFFLAVLWQLQGKENHEPESHSGKWGLHWLGGAVPAAGGSAGFWGPVPPLQLGLGEQDMGLSFRHRVSICTVRAAGGAPFSVSCGGCSQEVGALLPGSLGKMLPGKPCALPGEPSHGVYCKKRDLPQPRTYTCIFSRCRLTHPSCEAACEVPGHTQPPPAVAALAISSLSWAGNCYYFPLYQLHLLPARSWSSVFTLGGRCGAPSLAVGMHMVCKAIVSAAPGAGAAHGRRAPGLWGVGCFILPSPEQGRADKRLS